MKRWRQHKILVMAPFNSIQMVVGAKGILPPPENPRVRLTPTPLVLNPKWLKKLHIINSIFIVYISFSFNARIVLTFVTPSCFNGRSMER